METFNYVLHCLQEFWQEVHEKIYQSENFELYVVSVVLIASLIAVSLFYLFRKREVLILRSRSAKPRFRKRDKVQYYGRMILRKSKQVVNSAAHRPKSRQEFVKFAQKLLRMRRESKSLLPKEPPASILEADLTSSDSSNQLPTELIYLLQNVKVFGHFDQPVYSELLKEMESRSYRANQYVFQIGDADDSIYVVKEGVINLFIKDRDGREELVKEVLAGDSIHSLLSILDVLTGHTKPYKTVFARAVRDSTVLKLPGTAFEKAFKQSPKSMVSMVQVIMVRLIRVTFWALHNYLGLDHELMNQRSEPEIQEMLSTEGIKTLQKQTSREAREFLKDSRDRDEKFVNLVIHDLVKIFNLEDDSLLRDRVSVCHYAANQVLCNQGDADADMTFVIKGELKVSQRVIDQEGKETTIFTVGPGEVVGILAALSGEPSIFCVRTSVPCILAHITKKDFYAVMVERPQVVLNAAHLLVKRLSPFVRQIDFALDWMQVQSGRAIFHKGDQADHLYIILNGRIRTIMEGSEGKKSISGEYGKGELIGIGEVITRDKRSTTAMAVRDTELAQVPAQLLDHIRGLYPQIITRLYKLLGDRLMGIQMRLDEENLLSENPGVDPRSQIANISTVAVVPASDNVPLTAFTLELQHTLSTIAESLRLTSDIIERKVGSWALDPYLNADGPPHELPPLEPSVFDENVGLVTMLNNSNYPMEEAKNDCLLNDYRLSSWLAAQEDTHRTVIYQCDYRLTPWTQRCIRQSDVILLVALADEDPTPSELEKALEKGMSVRSQKELILLHKADAVRPQNTVDWLNARDWCLSHHHIKCPNRVFSRKSPERILAVYERVVQTCPDPLSDMSRLARFLTGTAIGLVLGGGGARGASQIGLIKAMVEANIPIDMVGGTSIGSFVGALWCEDRNITELIHRARGWFSVMTSLWKKILDLTYPITSMMTGHSFNRSIEDVFKETQIEDLWIPYFNITTDITASKMRVHTSGDLWRKVRASMTIPSILPPICDPSDGHLLVDGCFVNNLPGDLWRYVRASMSLSGYLPPLCDPKDGHLLLDGGYVNNLPADVMKAAGASLIFAVDVGATEDRNYTNYGDSLSGWWLLWKRWNPFTEPVRVPAMEEIQSHLAYISCVKSMEHIKRSGYCEYIRPPIDKYQTLQFNAFGEIMDCGYNHAKLYFEALSQTEKLRIILQRQDKIDSRKKGASFIHSVTSSLTDLADLMNQVKDMTSFDLQEALAAISELTETEDEDKTLEDSYNAELKAPVNA